MSSFFCTIFPQIAIEKNSQQKRMCVTKQNKWLQWRKKDPDWLCMVFLFFLFFYVECILLGTFLCFFLCIFGDGKLIDVFSSGKFFRNSNNNGLNNISYHYQITFFTLYSGLFHWFSTTNVVLFRKESSMEWHLRTIKASNLTSGNEKKNSA